MCEWTPNFLSRADLDNSQQEFLHLPVNEKVQFGQYKIIRLWIHLPKLKSSSYELPFNRYPERIPLIPAEGIKKTAHQQLLFFRR
jgi:hypothetical protein